MTQFVLQFLYLPLGLVLVIGWMVLAFWGGSVGGGGPDAADLADTLAGLSAAGISWRRLRVEWNGRPEEWERFTDELLRNRFAAAERTSGWRPAELPPSGVRRAVTGLERHHYRGLTPLRVEELAGRHDWSTDWAKSRAVQGQLHFYRLLPPPVPTGVPDPSGPPPEPGTPWGPMRCRVVVPLLTLVLVPRVSLLELRRSPNAYVRHLRKHLRKRFRAELARERSRNHYRFDGTGRVLRRVAVRARHYRGAGAAAVLRVAAEQGLEARPLVPHRPSAHRSPLPPGRRPPPRALTPHTGARPASSATARRTGRRVVRQPAQLRARPPRRAGELCRESATRPVSPTDRGRTPCRTRRRRTPTCAPW
ncbi:hypothetical protein [Kitasatospora sp. NPDC006786]|uniref:hypothetical protein n=1 Tax=unclassified Kitasatospora TaxID=2633591 RepID=UPI0033F9868E